MSGGVLLGTYNDHTLAIDTLQVLTCTPPPDPDPAELRRSWEQAYRSEMVARYAIWRNRYAPLPIQATPMTSTAAPPRFVEREELTFEAIHRTFACTGDGPDQGTARVAAHTFTDLREGLRRFGDVLLLGTPGGGKTTALWRLALDLAEDGLYRDPDAPLPIFVRLGGWQPAQTPMEVLKTELASAVLEDQQERRFPLEAHRRLVSLLPDLLASGRVVLLWDGLNEVTSAHFAPAARALAAFRRDHPGPMEGPYTRHLVTCRSEDYRLLVAEQQGRDPLPLTQATVQGLDAQMIRQFVIHRLGEETGTALLAALTDPRHRILAGLARTPLLLTMLCEVYAATRSLPTNRGKLLQTFIQQRWDWEEQRQTERWIAAATQMEGLASLAYAMTASRGRGTSVSWKWARTLLRKVVPRSVDLDRFCTLARQADLLEFLGDAQMDEQSLMLRFTHQLIQEYFAAQKLKQKIERVNQLRPYARLSSSLTWLLERELRRYAAPASRTGWEETLLLLVGIEGDGGHAAALIRTFLSQPIQAARLLLASGEEVDPLLLEEVQRSLMQAMTDTAIPVRDLVEAGRVLSDLGDPRFPVTPDQWQATSAGLTADPRSSTSDLCPRYWCYVPTGPYVVGSRNDDPDALDEEKPQHTVMIAYPFWIARYPITNAQWQAWVQEGRGTPSVYADDSDQNHPNQPVVGVGWGWFNQLCSWLTEQMGEVLPAGYAVQLPTEVEWEAAARGGDGQRYPWGDEWRDDHATTGENRKDLGTGYSTPVGCYATGVAPCGALDMAGNVWEWTADVWRSHPGAAKPFEEQSRRVLKGGSCWDDRAYVRCAARGRNPRGFVSNGGVGGRPIVAPACAQAVVTNEEKCARVDRPLPC
jgi:formylglycine-generating enzyme required for sulfatase activity